MSNMPESQVYREDRPWGYFYVFAENKKCTVKILKVAKGECLSLQRHKNRDQLYYIIDKLTIVSEVGGNIVPIEAEPESFFLFKAGELHRAMNNTEKEFARYLEISVGDYDENDIERIEDKYGR